MRLNPYTVHKFLLLFIVSLITINVKAQQPPPTYQDYGKVDKSDLEMTILLQKISLMMPNMSIIFKRMINEKDGIKL